MQDQLLDAVRRARVARQPLPENMTPLILQALEERAYLRNELENTQREVRERLDGKPDEPITDVLDRHIRTHLQLDRMITVLRSSKNQLIEAAIRFGTDLDALSAQLEADVTPEAGADSPDRG